MTAAVVDPTPSPLPSSDPAPTFEIDGRGNHVEPELPEAAVPDPAPAPAPAATTGERPAGGSAAAPAVVSGPAAFFSAVVTGVADQVRTTVKPAAVGAVASTFGFPLALTMAVLMYVAVQSRVDSRDPKLRFAPSTAGETYVPFQEEDDL